MTSDHPEYFSYLYWCNKFNISVIYNAIIVNIVGESSFGIYPHVLLETDSNPTTRRTGKKISFLNSLQQCSRIFQLETGV